MSRSELLDLDRSETAGVADAFDVLAERHGGREAASKATGITYTTFTKHSARIGARTMRTDLLQHVARALEVDAADILAGRGPKPTGDPRKMKPCEHRVSR